MTMTNETTVLGCTRALEVLEADALSWWNELKKVADLLGPWLEHRNADVFGQLVDRVPVRIELGRGGYLQLEQVFAGAATYGGGAAVHCYGAEARVNGKDYGRVHLEAIWHGRYDRVTDELGPPEWMATAQSSTGAGLTDSARKTITEAFAAWLNAGEVNPAEVLRVARLRAATGLASRALNTAARELDTAGVKIRRLLSDEEVSLRDYR